MSMNKKKKIMLMVVIAAVVMFAVSALAAGLNMSGYERLKTAGFKILEEFNNSDGPYSNGTYYADISAYIDGAVYQHMELISMFDGERKLSRESAYVDYGINVSMTAAEQTSVTYFDNDIYCTWYDDGRFTEFPNTRLGRNPYANDLLEMPARRGFVEAVADALIGETRNFFINDGNVVSISLSGNQIPEIAQYAIAAMAEDEARYTHDDDDIMLGPDARFSKGTMVVGLDGDELITDLKASFEITSTVNGVPRILQFELNFRSKNVGTTVVDKPDGNKNGVPVFPSYEDDGPLGAAYVSGADVS